MTQRRKGREAAVYAVLLLCFLYLAWKVPYAHDDWDWGLPVGYARWFSGEINNRYAGTAFVLAMTRSPLVKTLVMGLCMFAVPVMSARLAAKEEAERLPLTVLSAAALTAMPMFTWRQTYGWVSAFANFVTAAVFLLGILLLLRTCLKTPSRTARIALPILCFFTSFFVENLTVCLTLFALCLFVWSLRTNKCKGLSLAILCACAAGCVFTFYNPIYQQLLTTGRALEGIRKLSFPAGAPLGEIVRILFTRYFTVILPCALETDPAALAVLSAGCVFSLVRRGAAKILPVITGLFLGACCILSQLTAGALRENFSWVCPYPAARTALCAGAALVIVLITVTDRGEGRPLPALLVLGAFALTVPFAAVSEMGPRCCYLSAVLLLTAGLCLLHGVRRSGILRSLACIAAAAALAFHMEAYHVIGKCSELRQELLIEAVETGAGSVILPTEPWRCSYTWGRNVQTERWAVYFREFYGLPADMELILLPYGSYELWPEIDPEQLASALRYP